MSASDGCKEAVYLNRLLGEILDRSVNPVNLYMDNQSAIKIAENPVFHNRTKHIDIRYHYIREVVGLQKVKLLYKPTDEMTADILTKGLGRVKHELFVKGMGLVKCSGFNT